jgi:NAD(P)-dependent dehydrogenase (short-subunit alcohol dehydrogenase family)
MDTNALFSIAGKTAVVTGGSRGIGFMIAEGFISAGADVYITARKAEACDAAAAALNEIGPGKCVSLPFDLSGEEGAKAFAAVIAERTPKVDILVNNAGATWGAPIEDFPDSAWDKVLDINVKGLFQLTSKLLPQLRAAATAEDPARVINIGSVDGINVPGTQNYAYAASKAAVHHLTRQMAHNLTRDHITVNAIAPGPFRSKMMAFILDNEGGEEMVGKGVPLGRIGSPEDVAGLSIFLSSRAGSYLTGAVIPCDGGISTKSG